MRHGSMMGHGGHSHHGWMTSHGISVEIFPMPAVSYTVMGMAHATVGEMVQQTNVSRLQWSDVRQNKSLASAEASAAIHASLLACPSIRRRFDLHARNPELRPSLEAASEEERLIIVASSFPELA